MILGALLPPAVIGFIVTNLTAGSRGLCAGLPKDIGPIAVFLPSDAAFWVNGSKILAGGGVTM
jgi:NAD(P)-dependent dehydrogenase (short-subunit alcohol dehydrogenase family)